MFVVAVGCGYAIKVLEEATKARTIVKSIKKYKYSKGIYFLHLDRILCTV